VLGAAFSTGILIRGLAASILGGFERPFGAVFGGLIVGIIDSVVGHLTVRSEIPGLSTSAVLAVIVALVLLRPRGLTEVTTQ
jgi:branched-chain amino acid transport system permease protein